jgi:molybdenum cofactor biosynthesis enzyme MoaA
MGLVILDANNQVVQSLAPVESSEQYVFRDHLTEAFPSQLLVDVTESCNLECIHCPHPEFKKSHHYAGRKVLPELNEKLVDEVGRHGKGLTQYIRYASNGEPMIHPAIFQMLTYAVDNSDVVVTLTTNGTLMNQKRIDQLLDTGLHHVDISIDAHFPETYAQIRKRGDLNRTRGNVLNLINEAAKRNHHLKVVVSYVEQDLNRGETDLFESFWKQNGASFVVVRRQHSCSGANEEQAEIQRAENQNIKRRPCLYPWERVVLNASGNLAFCPSDWSHGSVIGPYEDLTIKDVWQGEFYKKLRQAHLTNNYSCHGFCGQCPDWLNTRWPHEGRSYASMMQEMKAVG